jgi:hypothetical protein
MRSNFTDSKTYYDEHKGTTQDIQLKLVRRQRQLYIMDVKPGLLEQRATVIYMLRNENSTSREGVYK